MCGIFAQVGLVDSQKAVRAASSFEYRGPDGTRMDDEDGVTLIQHRLAILDTRSIADQPFWNDSGSVGAVFNGEIYNFRDLRKAHFPDTTVWRTEGDTEVIIRLYDKYGPSFTKYLDGMYAIVLLDRERGRLLAFRDTFGVKPLYYATTESGFACASELKGVVATLREAGERVTPQAGIIDLYATLGYIPAPRTVVSEVSVLMPGTYLTYDLKTRKASLGRSPANEESDDVQEKGIIDVAARSVMRNTIADVPVGVFLSGGIDSTFIAHVLGTCGQRMEAFTMEIPERRDAGFARAVATHYGLTHVPLRFTQELFDESYRTIRERIDQPTADSSLIPTLALARFARERVKVVLSGEGGDEIFLGYPRHLELARMTAHPSVPPGAAITGLLPRRAQLALSRLSGDTYGYYALAAGVVPTRAGVREFTALTQEAGVAPLDIDLAFYLENDLLRKIDLGTMYASLEGRVPFCSSLVLSTARAAGIGVLQASGIAKAPLKAYLAGHLPHDIVYRKKSGFSIPFSAFATRSEQVAEDDQHLGDFLQERFPERSGSLRMSARRNHYLWYALLSLMHAYRNLGL